MIKKKLYIFIILWSFSFNSFAQNISIIRDAETENFLYDLTKPIFEAANLDLDNIKIYIVNNNSLNAFVFGGQNIFINTGLITKYDQPDVLVGVIAHETGHIASGHLARGSEEMGNIGNSMILTYLVGIAAAIAADPNLGYAVIMGGNQVIGRLALKYNRGQEESADKLALQYLDKINYPSSGLLELLQFFDSQETGYKDLIDEYTLTHPVSKKRINYIKSNLNKSDYSRQKINFQRLKMVRIIVKLESFLGEPNKILSKYYQNNPLSQYARSIAYFKKGEVKKSLEEINNLIASGGNYFNEKDGYLWELKGQILFESGFVKEAIIAYQKAVKLQQSNSLQHSPSLAKIALASAVISLNSYDKELTDFAINNLLDTLPKEKDNPNVFKQLSRAYNQNDNKGRSYLALAEFYLLQGNEDKTAKYAKLAKNNLDKNDKTGLIKAQDILDTVS